MAANECGPVVPGDDAPFVLPRIPASSGAMIFDRSGRLLIANPTYKDHWTIPGGIMEADGETPWEACRREVLEEVGLVVETGRLVAVDFLHPKRSEPGGMRFLFDCGTLSDTELAEGHASFRYAGFVTVSAPSEEELVAACDSVQHAAGQSRLMLRRLYGDQASGYTCTLPLCRGLR